MQDEMVPLPDSVWLAERFQDYANTKSKIQRLVKSGRIVRLKQGKYIAREYLQDPSIRPRVANWLYGPSYVSFAWALRWYGLIPEDVPHVTSATFGKRRTKRFDTPIGSLFYRDVPQSAYPASITIAGDKDRRFLVATPEKALCDELHTYSGTRTLEAVRELVFESLRIDEEDLQQLDLPQIAMLAQLYSSQTVRMFHRFMERLNGAVQ